VPSVAQVRGVPPTSFIALPQDVVQSPILQLRPWMLPAASCAEMYLFAGSYRDGTGGVWRTRTLPPTRSESAAGNC